MNQIARKVRTLCCLMGITVSALCQVSDSIDTLRVKIPTAKNDTIRMILLQQMATSFEEISPDSSIVYAEKAIAIARKLDLKLEEAYTMGDMAYGYLNLGVYPRSLKILLDATAIAENEESERKILPAKYPHTLERLSRSVSARRQRLDVLGLIQQFSAVLYGTNAGQFEKALYYYKHAVPTAREADNKILLCNLFITMGRTYNTLKKPDSALLILQQAYQFAREANYNKHMGSILLNTGRVYVALHEMDKAFTFFKRALTQSRRDEYFRGVVATDLELAKMYRLYGKPDSTLYHIKDAVSLAKRLKTPDLRLRSYAAMADFYKKVNSDSTVKYQELVIDMNNQIFNSGQVQQFQNIDLDAQQRQQELKATEKDYQTSLKLYGLIAGLVLFLMLVIFLWRIGRQREKSNKVLQQQKADLEVALSNLKAAQNQLIQSEKMASLGEMTAGIAHEIQNPLNFVNNFSEVSNELLEEMKAELGKGNATEAKAIADNVKQNIEKVLNHGKRADSIVKSMLQHSRASTGQKETTDINALCDEYLRLAFHGLRAKDKSFSAKFETNLDPSIGPAQVVPQDIGRVLLNLINNAFYAVTEKQKLGISPYEPVVKVTSKKMHDKIEIRIIDNGIGIPARVVEKIFQPFFTTKPAGQGTGLGLSLSYDIITKGHGGELKVETKEGEGTTFIVSLPV
ncbi:MAG: tetratricopeptide repeat protein [Bacteroidetes bacterium]|nr:tetratricopeptide repeat protein [Bacteroidota bacterium]